MYYGDEIGMGDNVYLGDYFPVINDPPYGYQIVNVDTQERSQSSLLNWVRAIVALRGSYHAFGRGTFESVAAENHRVLAFIRRHDDEIILCVNNLALHAQYAAGWSPMELWSGQALPDIARTPYQLTMSERRFFWFRLMSPGGPARLGVIAPVGA